MKDLKAFYDFKKRWPAIDKAIEMETLMRHINKWCKDRNPEDKDAITGMKQEMIRYIIEHLKDVPREELHDAVAETIAATLVQQLFKLFEKLAGEGEEGGFAA